jgi:CheY-like chemotaxis protein
MARPRILLVDDDPDFLDIAESFLKLHGYDVIAVADIAEGRRLLEQEAFTVAFLDINFDRSDSHDKQGLEMAIQTVYTSSVPKVILTVYKTPDYTREALVPRDGKGAALDFLSKADGLPQMLETITNILQHARIFLSYAQPDRAAVENLYDRLRMSGFNPWMDKKDLVGGEVWETAVRNVMRETDFVVVCLSEASINRSGYFHTEIEMALKIHGEQPPGKIFLIPLRFEPCEIIHDRLPDLHRIDYFEADGYERLTRALKVGISRHAEKR